MSAAKSTTVQANAVRSVLYAAAIAGMMACTGQASAAVDGPFAQFAGNWSGGGTITVQNGSRERIRCRGRYVAGRPASTISLSLRCASDSYRFELQSEIQSEGGRISGSWNELSRQIYGQIGGRVTSNHIDAQAAAVGFNATLSLTIRGNRQEVAIRSPGSEISEVLISLTRGR